MLEARRCKDMPDPKATFGLDRRKSRLHIDFRQQRVSGRFLRTKFKVVVNLKTAKALGLTIPSAVLARAEEAME